MKKLFATTALALILSGAALAQTSTTQPGAASTAANDSAAAIAWMAQSEARDVFASDIIGATLYAAEDGQSASEARDDWDSVGSVHDVLLSRDGQVRAVLVDVGEFLGMGGKTVAVPADAISYVSDGEEAGDYFLVISASRETLEAAPEYVRPERDADRMRSDGTSPAAATDKSDAGARAALGSGPDARSMPERDGYTRAPSDAMTAEKLKDLEVYDREDRSIGSINELLIDGEGKITDAVVDVGGFLGLGARSVALKFEDLTMMRRDGGDDVRLYVNATKDQLEEMPRYEK